jgi:DHA2 family methylenomycin A resistance protein-like MFS transporter
VAALASGRLVGRFGEHGPLVIGLAGGGLAMLGLLRLATDGPDTVWWNLALLGAGIGLCGTPMSAIAMSAVDSRRAGMASAVINAMRQLGQVFGVAVLGALVYAGPSIHQGAGRLRPPEAGHFVDGLHHALTLSGVALIATALLAAVLTRPRRTPRSEEAAPAGAETI